MFVFWIGKNKSTVFCRIRPSGQVYISGVRGLSTAWINAAVSQRIELTCDADACGAKVEGKEELSWIPGSDRING